MWRHWTELGPHSPKRQFSLWILLITCWLECDRCLLWRIPNLVPLLMPSHFRNQYADIENERWTCFKCNSGSVNQFTFHSYKWVPDTLSSSIASITTLFSCDISTSVAQQSAQPQLLSSISTPPCSDTILKQTWNPEGSLAEKHDETVHCLVLPDFKWKPHHTTRQPAGLIELIHQWENARIMEQSSLLGDFNLMVFNGTLRQLRTCSQRSPSVLSCWI